MKLFLTFLLLAASTVRCSNLRGSTQDDQVPNAELVIPEIVGGTSANSKDYPYMVSVQNKDGYHVCGATLIAPDVILTAAHCLEANLFSAQIGAYNLERNTDRFDLGEKCRHPNYDTDSSSNDFVLFKLKNRKVSRQNEIYPLIDDGSRPLKSGDSLKTIGFGTLAYESESSSSILREITIKYMTNDQCRATGYDSSWITNTMMCATAPNKDSCQGDSGGPLLQMSANNKDVLVGVTSWGIECANENYPGVYARISSVSKWIKNASCYLSDDKSGGACDNESYSRAMCG